LRWRGEFVGPESLTFDAQGRGPYTGISDGRVVRYDGPQLGWSTFAYTSKNRSEICAPKQPPAPNLPHEHICGRPLGLRFEKKTGDLWIADGYLGILKVGPEGGQAEPVLTEIDGIPLRFCNDLDFDHDGVLYFTDSSTRWARRQFFLSVLEADATGRFIKYDPATKETTVLMKDLRFPNGVAVSKDGSFIVLCESRTGRLWRYWLKGEKEGAHEIFVLLPGWPDNVRSNSKGDFWVAIHALRNTRDLYLGLFPWLRYLAVRFPIPQKYLYPLITGYPHAMVIRYGADGNVKEVLEDQTGKVVKLVSEVEEHEGKLYLGSVLLPQIAVYTLPTSSDS
jgi:sugar lactone lactonase YvrE